MRECISIYELISFNDAIVIKGERSYVRRPPLYYNAQHLTKNLAKVLQDLWAEDSQNVPTTGFVRLMNAYVLGPAIVVHGLLVFESVDSLFLPWESEEEFERKKSIQIDRILSKCKSGALRTIKSAVLCARPSGLYNYGNWMTDVFPILIAATKHLPRVPKVVARGGPIDTHQDRVLEAIGKVGRSEVIEDRGGVTLYRELWVPFGFQRHPVWKAPETSELLRRTFRRKRIVSTHARKVLVVTRPEGGRRQCQNVQAVIEFVTRLFGTPIVYRYEGETIEEQAQLFQNARAVIGVCGAEMASTVFCEVDTPVIYLASQRMPCVYYWDLSCHVGLRHGEVRGPTEGIGEDFTVDLAELREAMDRVMVIG